MCGRWRGVTCSPAFMDRDCGAFLFLAEPTLPPLPLWCSNERSGLANECMRAVVWRECVRVNWK